MELRQFGQYKSRTWYVSEPFKKKDIIVIFMALLFIVIVIILFYINDVRLYYHWKE